ncbi:hypothetical protein MaudCBS49596_000413 [Microsporum audouinii]
MALNPIPDNDPNFPRWLLDLEKWAIRPYQEIQEELGGKPEYGIISYTWGKYAIGIQNPADLPQGIMWDVPLVSAFSLNEAQRVMKSMKRRYVWWDWMCVPQGRAPDLSNDLLRAKGEEIGKQMAIYRGATSSIVWVHQTNWAKESSMRTLLKDGIPPAAGDFSTFFSAVLGILEDVRETEPWLKSIWTLQEGVLLSETILLDHDGNVLEDERFIHNNGCASVIDLTAGITQLVIRLGADFMRLSNRGEAEEDEETPLMAYIRQGENYAYVAGVLATIMRSGLVAYAKGSPLYILSGKVNRFSSQPEDYCWALLGALDLTFPNTWYHQGEDMDLVKKEFFKPLLERWQWNLFLVAGVVNSGEYDALSWPERVVDGKMLSLGIYFDVFWKKNLPKLSWVDANQENGMADMIILNSSEGENQCALWKLTQPGRCRRYVQTEVMKAKEAIVRVENVEGCPPEVNRSYLPIADLDKQSNRPGTRCIEIEPLDETTGLFRGVVDLWVAEDAVAKMECVSFRLVGRTS